jgi:hypothetical protein
MRRAYQSDLSDEEWSFLEPLLPAPTSPRRSTWAPECMKRPGCLPPGKSRSGTVSFRGKQPRFAGPRLLRLHVLRSAASRAATLPSPPPPRTDESRKLPARSPYSTRRGSQRGRQTVAKLHTRRGSALAATIRANLGMCGADLAVNSPAFRRSHDGRRRLLPCVNRTSMS